MTRVRYRVEETRVGQRVNYDRLVLEIWTKGTVAPEDALVEAAKILRKHLNPFVQYYELGESQTAADHHATVATPVMDEELRSKLERSVSDLDLSVRAGNCLEAARILTVGELVKLTEDDLLQLRSFGKTSLTEVKAKLAELGLSLGIAGDSGRLVQRGCDGQRAGDAADLEDTNVRHLVRGRRLSRTSAHRLALRRNMVQSLIEHGEIRTTLPKAKEIRGFAEKLVSLAIDGSLAARQRAIAMLKRSRHHSEGAPGRLTTA